MTINEFAAEVHKNAVEHGWWEGERTFPEIVALIHSEVSEALEEYRDGKPLLYFPCKRRFGISTDLFNERAQTAPQERSYSI